jgi:hypothetical protein
LNPSSGNCSTAIPLTESGTWISSTERFGNAVSSYRDHRAPSPRPSYLRAAERKRKQRLDEQQQREALKRQQEEETRALKAAELAIRQEAEKIKRVKVEALLSSANGHLKNDSLSLVNVFSAHQEFEQLRNLDYTDPNVRQLQKDLIDAYTILALRDNSDEVYKLAISALEQGVQLNPLDRKKLQIRSQLSR